MDLESFLKKVESTLENKSGCLCWAWDPTRYQIIIEGTKKLFFRALWEAKVGPIRDNHIIINECKTHWCCDWRTCLKEVPRQKTKLPGDHNPSAKLTNVQVLEIQIALQENRASKQELAAKYGISMAQMYRIARGMRSEPTGARSRLLQDKARKGTRKKPQGEFILPADDEPDKSNPSCTTDQDDSHTVCTDTPERPQEP